MAWNFDKKDQNQWVRGNCSWYLKIQIRPCRTVQSVFKFTWGITVPLTECLVWVLFKRFFFSLLVLAYYWDLLHSQIKFHNSANIFFNSGQWLFVLAARTNKRKKMKKNKKQNYFMVSHCIAPSRSWQHIAISKRPWEHLVFPQTVICFH